MKHEEIEDAAVIGVPDKDRGNIVKAFLKVRQPKKIFTEDFDVYASGSCVITSFLIGHLINRGQINPKS